MRLYLDEDSQSRASVAALRQAGHDVLTTAEAGQMESPDDAQLAFALAESRAILTANRGDFARLHAEYLAAGLRHAGILIREQGWSPGLLVRLVAAVDLAYADAGLHGSLEYLSSWHDE